MARAYRFGATTARAASPEEQKSDRATYELKSVGAARRAVELDSNFVEGQVVFATTLSGPRKWLLSEDVLSKALALDPSNPEALSAYSGLLLGVGRVKEAIAMKQRLNQLEPYIPLYNGNLAEALWLDGQNDAAIAIMKDNLGREGAGAELGLGRMYASLGRFDEAADIGSTMLSQPIYQDYSDLVSVAVRLLRSAPAKVAEPEKLPNLAEGNYIYLYVGAPERALEFYEEGGRRANEIALLWHPSYSPVRKMDRFKTIIRDEGLVNYWRERGWPSFCRPVGADDFVCD